MKHLITGASGFLGTHLVDWLLQRNPGDTVISLGFKAPANGHVRHIEADLLDAPRVLAALRETLPDRIYHLAGSARVSQDIGMPEYYQSNFVTTQNLIAAVEGTLPRVRIFFSSSVHVYGDREGQADEACEPAPNGFYGMSKYLGERAFDQLVQRAPEIRVVVGRLYSCIGPGQGEGFVTADLTRKLVALPADGSRPLETGPLTAYRRFLDVRDAVQLIAGLLENDSAARFEVVNIASPFEMQVREVVEMLVRVSGKKTPIRARENNGNPFRGLDVSLSKLQRLVPGFQYRPLETTLRDLWDWGSKSF